MIEKKNCIWIELDMNTSREHAQEMCDQANAVLKKLGFPIDKEHFFIRDRNGNVLYCFGGNYGYEDLADRGKWFNLEYLAKPDSDLAEALEVIEALLEQADMGEVDEETQAIVDKARSVIIKAKGK
jgi:hypothetical protein